MRKNTLGKSQTSGASSAGTSGTKVHQRKFITLDEVAYEASRLLLPYALSITEEIQAFTDLDVKDLNGDMKSLRKPYYKSPKKYLKSEGNGNKLTRFVIRNLSAKA
jgi:hypothetical protein